MSIENKVVDFVMESNLEWGVLLQLSDVTTENNETLSTVPVNLTGFTFRGAISKSLEDSSPLMDLSIRVVSTTAGTVQISLTKAQVDILTANASTEIDIYNPRIRRVGYYDVIMTKTTGSISTDFRILEGRVLISKGVTS